MSQSEFERLRDATKENPNDGGAWCALGDFYFEETENPNLAVKAYLRAQELLPQQDLRSRLGRAYVRMRETEKGLELMQASANEFPRAEAYCFLASAFLELSLPQEAEAAARKAIQLEPSFEEAHYLLGEALKNRDAKASIDAFRTAVALNERYALAWQGLGRELLHQKDFDGALKALLRSVSLDGSDVWARLFLANTLWQKNDLDKAREQYLAALELAPESPDVRRWYKQFLEKENLSD